MLVFEVCKHKIWHKSSISSCCIPSTLDHFGSLSQPTIGHERLAKIVKVIGKRVYVLVKHYFSFQHEKICMAIFLGFAAPLHCLVCAGCQEGFPQSLTRESLFVRAIRRCF